MQFRWTSLALAAALTTTAFGLQGCYGSFNLTRKLYTWNGNLGDKWINSLAMFAMLVLPVYSVAGLVDYVLLNTVEFWTGKNPVAMAPGEKEEKLVTVQGRNYLAIATQNRFQLTPTDGGAALNLVYVESDKAWYSEIEGEKILIAEWMDENSLALVEPSGKRVLLTR
jgi:Domain of unknown function (DUF3332)